MHVPEKLAGLPSFKKHSAKIRSRPFLSLPEGSDRKGLERIFDEMSRRLSKLSRLSRFGMVVALSLTSFILLQSLVRTQQHH